jgi:hypothetical protein
MSAIKFPPTVILDLDGVLVKHGNPYTWFDPILLLDGVLPRLREWWDAGVRIIIMTGRPECQRSWVATELVRNRIFYHQLVMNAGSGVRFLVNDRKPYAANSDTAFAVNLDRDEGLAGFDLLGHPGALTNEGDEGRNN